MNSAAARLVSLVVATAVAMLVPLAGPVHAAQAQVKLGKAHTYPATGALRWEISEHVRANFLGSGSGWYAMGIDTVARAERVRKAVDGTLTTYFTGGIDIVFTEGETRMVLRLHDPITVVRPNGSGAMTAIVGGQVTGPVLGQMRTTPSRVTVLEFTGARSRGITTTVAPDWRFHPEFLGNMPAPLAGHFDAQSAAAAAAAPGDSFAPSAPTWLTRGVAHVRFETRPYPTLRSEGLLKLHARSGNGTAPGAVKITLRVPGVAKPVRGVAVLNRRGVVTRMKATSQLRLKGRLVVLPRARRAGTYVVTVRHLATTHWVPKMTSPGSESWLSLPGDTGGPRGF